MALIPKSQRERIPFGDTRIPESVWIRVVRGDSCWFWTGARDSSGYGHIRRKGRLVSVHRFVLECIGIAIDGMLVMHSCDEPGCVNPNHLSAGTASDNQMDSVNKHRHGMARRIACPRGHLYEEHGVIRSGKRYCKLCQAARARDKYHATKEAHHGE